MLEERGMLFGLVQNRILGSNNILQYYNNIPIQERLSDKTIMIYKVNSHVPYNWQPLTLNTMISKLIFMKKFILRNCLPKKEISDQLFYIILVCTPPKK